MALIYTLLILTTSILQISRSYLDSELAEWFLINGLLLPISYLVTVYYINNIGQNKKTTIFRTLTILLNEIFIWWNTLTAYNLLTTHNFLGYDYYLFCTVLLFDIFGYLLFVVMSKNLKENVITDVDKSLIY